ncbi:MAG: hypothetical protein QOF89_871 [Acidobacteriota bacterium]|nr:hypothetical protein [Acidobacteriota bacterium]
MDDLLLKELADLARREEETEKARLDERWDRLAAGTLTAEEETELKALAESSPEAREAYEAFRPLGADFQARVVNAINAERTSEAPAPEPREERPRVLPFRRVTRRMEVWIGAAAVVAAGVFFLVRGPALPLPSYEASLDGGFKTNRGSEAATPNEKRIFASGSPFILEINPKQPLEHPGAVKARAFLSPSAGWEDLRPLGLEDKFEPGKTGSVRLTATMGEDDLKVPPGDWIFWTVVARNSLPEAKEVQTRLRANRPQNESWQTLCDALKQEKPSPGPWQVACVDFRAEGQPAAP